MAAAWLTNESSVKKEHEFQPKFDAKTRPLIDHEINPLIDNELLCKRADALLNEQRLHVFVRTDRLFAALLIAEWIAGICLSLIISPSTWDGTVSKLHPHVLMAVLGGGALAAFPFALVMLKPGSALTRHVVAISQMLFSALFIDITGGRIETHFHIFGSLAFLAFYRDWRVLVSASTVVAIYHLLGGFLWPQAIFGVSYASPYRALEHIAWVIFEDIFLFTGIAQNEVEMAGMAMQSARILQTNENIECLVDEKTKKLHATELESKRLATIVEQNEDAILSIGTDGRIQSWNRGAEKISWYKSEDVVDLLYDPALPLAVKKQYRKLLKMAKKGQPVEALESIIYRKDGTLVPTEMTMSPIRDENGKVEAFSMIVRDITQKKIADKRITEFYSVISHELRTPLTSIRGALGLIADGVIEQGSNEATELIGIAQKSTTRLIRLINDMLDLRKIEAGKFDLNLAIVCVKDLTDSAVADMRGFAEEKKVRLSAVIDEQCFVEVDQDRLTQVLSNLISNAIKYAPENSVVEVKAQKTDNLVRFSVTDTGAGIPKQEQHKLFGKFQQIDSSNTRAKEGSGLGLAISKAIVEEHGGKLQFCSEPDVKTVFWFELGIVKDKSVSLPASTALAASTTLTASTTPLASTTPTDSTASIASTASTAPTSPTASSASTAATASTDSTDSTVSAASTSPSADESGAGTVLVLDRTKILSNEQNKKAGARQRKILIVEDDLELSSMLRIDLENQNYACHQAYTLGQAMEFLKSQLPDAIVLDLELPDGFGLDLLDDLHCDVVDGGQLDKLDSSNNSNSLNGSNDLANLLLPVIVITGSDRLLTEKPYPVVDWLKKPFSSNTLRDAVSRALKGNSLRRVVSLAVSVGGHMSFVR